MKNYSSFFQLAIFGGILLFLTAFLIGVSINLEKKRIIFDFLSRQSIHIQNMDVAKQEYLHIQKALIDGKDDALKLRLSARAVEIFKNEKFILGLDKDMMLAELKGLLLDIDKQVLVFGDLVDRWCESVKNDTIESFANTPDGDQKFFAVLRLRDQIVTIRRMYSSIQASQADLILIGIPLLGSLAGLMGQIFSIYKECKASQSTGLMKSIS